MTCQGSKLLTLTFIRVVTVCAAQASLRHSIKHTCTPTVVLAGSSFVGPQSVTSSSTSDRCTQSPSDIGFMTTPAPFLSLSICTETNAQSCTAYETFPSTRSEGSMNVSVLVWMTQISRGKAPGSSITQFASADLSELPGSHLQSSTRCKPNPIERVAFGP